MVSARKERQQNKRLFNQLNESDADFIIVQNNHEAQAGDGTNVVDIGISSNNMKVPIQVNGQQVDIHTLEKSFVGKVGSEEDKVIKTVKTRVQDAVLTAIEVLVIPTVQLAMKLADASPGRVLTVTYCNLTKVIFRLKSKAYRRPHQVE